MVLIADIHPDNILQVSPYNALGYGLALAVLLWVIYYFKNQIAEKDKVIGELIDKNHTAYNTISEKLTELNTQNQIDKSAIISDLKIIKSALEI